MKKKILSLLLALLMLSSSAAMMAVGGNAEDTSPKNVTHADRVLGDINGDTAVDIQDAMALFQHSMMPDYYPIDYPGMTDFDKNGTLDLGDALYLFQHSMMPDFFPIEWGDSTELPETEAPETEAPETEAPETENYLGDCGNIYWDNSNTMVGHLRLDAFRHQGTQADYARTVENGTITVEEELGIFDIAGWVGMNFTDFELGWRIGTANEVQYSTQSASLVQREEAVYQAAKAEGYSNATGFMYNFDIGNFKSGDEIHLFLKDKSTGTVYCFFELVIIIKGANQAVDPAILEKYELGKDSDLNLSVSDPIENHEPVTAPDDDSSLKLWFDHITEKVSRYDVSGKDSGKNSYTIQMGKNEMEGCQFFLYSPTARKVTIKLSDFVNGKGETLPAELGVEYYIEDGYIIDKGYPADRVYPDAVVPYDSYVAYSSNNENGRYGNDKKSQLNYGPYVCVGPFSAYPSKLDQYPFRDSVRGFTVQTITAKDTTPGAYKATVEIYDADTGKCIKMANVYTYVYDVILSDETALDTAFGLWDITEIYKHHYNSDSNLTKYSDAEITRATANLFLKYRITLTGNNAFFNRMGQAWFENPRVTSIRVVSKAQYDSLKNMPELAKKMFYYGQDEPGVARGYRPITWPSGRSETVYDNTGLLSVLAIAREADMLKSNWGWKDYRLLIPFERTMDFTTFDFTTVDKSQRFPSWYNQYAVTDQRDSIEYLSEYVNLWTATFTGATPKELAPAVLGDQYMQNDGQDVLFGEFQSRMEGLQAEGHEIWNYVACQPPYNSPYQNILLFNDGTEGRTMFWTTYLLNSTGFLYWHVSYYDAIGNNTYTLRCPFSKTGPGDGILVYPGSAYNQLDPIPSIRLLNMRDGIEDYQLLTMLKDAKGEAYTDELVSHIVTSTVTFTRDDDTVYNAHAFLLKTLEDANK